MPSTSQKKNEAQANLFFFLEGARGFYTNLLEDIIQTYDFNELVRDSNGNTKLIGSNFLLPFCQRFPSIFDKINFSNYSIIESRKNRHKLDLNCPDDLKKSDFEKSKLYFFNYATILVIFIFLKKQQCCN